MVRWWWHGPAQVELTTGFLTFAHDERPDGVWTVPLASIVLRRAYGIAGSAMSNAETYQYRYCWPSGDWGSLPIAGGLEVAYKSDLEAAEDPAAELAAIRADERGPR